MGENINMGHYYTW